MRSLVAIVVSAGMVWTSAASEAGLGEVRQEAGKAAGAHEKAAPTETVKPVAGADFAWRMVQRCR